MVFKELPMAQSSPNLSRSNLATPAKLDVGTLTTDVINTAIVSTSTTNNVTSTVSLSGVKSQEPNSVQIMDIPTNSMSTVRERHKVKRNINGVIKRPNLRRINHTHNVDIIIEESPEELLSISPVNNTSNFEDVTIQKNAKGSDHGSTVSLTSFEKHLLGGDNSYEDDTSLSSIDKMSITRIDDVMANVNNYDVISLTSMSSMDITFTADINGHEVKFIESMGKY